VCVFVCCVCVCVRARCVCALYVCVRCVCALYVCVCMLCVIAPHASSPLAHASSESSAGEREGTSAGEQTFGWPGRRVVSSVAGSGRRSVVAPHVCVVAPHASSPLAHAYSERSAGEREGTSAGEQTFGWPGRRGVSSVAGSGCRSVVAPHVCVVAPHVSSPLMACVVAAPHPAKV
jgi:hypothetical protein